MELLRLYFDTFESCYRILHLPSFWAEYESHVGSLETAPSSFVVKLLLVMSITATLRTDEEVRNELRDKVPSWIHVCQTWLSGPLEKDRLALDGIQTHCLLLTARQVNRVGADLVRISAGSLTRMAMQMGLHQDPDLLGVMGVLQKEMRRRLWYTILELNIQAALDSGMSPMITAADYNTRPPSNASDDELNDSMLEDLPEKGNAIPTQTSIQRLLASSLSLRLQVAALTNSLHGEPSYDQVIRLGSELALACRNAGIMFDQYTSANNNNNKKHPPTQFAYICAEHCLRRFTLYLHYPYAVQANRNALYSYSQKACLEAALDDNAYRHFLLTGGGMFPDITTRAALIIFVDLVWQLDADGPAFTRRRNDARRQPQLTVARKVVQYAHERFCYGETSVKGYVFISMAMAMAQVEAMLEGSSVRDATLDAASRSVAVCHGTL